MPERHLLQIDEEPAPTSSRVATTTPQISEICAAKFAKAAELDGVACVVDATACVGGNSIAFARRFPRVVSIDEEGELNVERSRMLAHNITHVRRFHNERLGRVDVVQGDCLEKLPTLDVDWSQTLVFADPPWGGRHYEDCQDVDSEQGVHLKGKGHARRLRRDRRGPRLPAPPAQGAAHLRRGAVFGEYGRRALRRARRRRQGAARRARAPCAGEAARAVGAPSSSKRKKKRRKKKRASKVYLP